MVNVHNQWNKQEVLARLEQILQEDRYRISNQLRFKDTITIRRVYR